MLTVSGYRTGKRNIAVRPYSRRRMAGPAGMPDSVADGELRRVMEVGRIAKMTEKVRKSTRDAVLHSPTKPLRADGDPPAPPVKDKNDSYPACMTLRADEIEHARHYPPRSIGGAEYIWWDFPQPRRL